MTKRSSSSSVNVGYHVHNAAILFFFGNVTTKCSILTNCIFSMQTLLTQKYFDLLDLRYVDDVLIFPETANEFVESTNMRVECLREAGPCLNASKTKVSTTETQPPHFLIQLQVNMCKSWVRRHVTHGWVARRLLESLRFQLWTRTFIYKRQHVFFSCANRDMLCDHNVSICKRLRYFHSIVSPVACFVAGHKAIHQIDFNKLDIQFRKVLRSVVGPPASIDCNLPWQTIWHEWNARVKTHVDQSGIPV